MLIPKNGRLALLRIIGEEVFLPISCGMYFEAKLALEREERIIKEAEERAKKIKAKKSKKKNNIHNNKRKK